MLESAIIHIAVGIGMLFVMYIVAAILLYYVMCVIEWCQEIKNKRR